MTRRVHILFEHGADLQPFGSAYVRLLQPFSHPSLAGQVEMTSGLTYDRQPVDVVVVDRLWRPDISTALARDLVERVHAAGARLLYAIDDNLLDLAAEARDWQPSQEQIGSVELFLREADAVMVSTPALCERLAAYNAAIHVVPHALDERLLWQEPQRPDRPDGWRSRIAGLLRRGHRAPRLVIGYMGTFTHDQDLLMVLPALRRVCQRRRGEIELQLIGVAWRAETIQALDGLPVRRVELPPGASAYPQFMAWFTRDARWDLAIAPLCDSPFNRCKSDIKFLDYCASGAAGIYSRVPSYASSVRHGATGWLVDNTPAAWEAALEELLGDERLCTDVADAARHYLYDERVLARRAPAWLAMIDSVTGR